ncbi:hypothetical protein [Actinomadura coerulea]
MTITTPDPGQATIAAPDSRQVAITAPRLQASDDHRPRPRGR